MAVLSPMMFLPRTLAALLVGALLVGGPATRAALAQGAPDPEPAPMPTVTALADNAPATTSAPTATAAGDLIEPMIKDITRNHNVMPHLLVGIGVVAGLGGTGASDRGTRQAILNVISDQGLKLTIADVVGGNTALVSLTASVQPFAKQGSPIHVRVQAIGDSQSLRGGELLRAELRGVDGLTHVVVQGKVMVGGISAKGENASVQKNVSTTGDVPDGGYVIRDMPSSYYSEAGDLELEVTRPSPFNAMSIASGCRRALSDQDVRITAIDPTMVRITLPPDARTDQNALAVLGRIGTMRVPIENPHKVTIDPSTGTIVVGEGVLISPCVVGLTDLTISVVDDDQIVQPNPLAGGDTARVGRTRIEVQTNNSEFKPVQGGATVAALVQNLKALGLTPSQLVSVFQALDSGGFLQAKLEVQ